MINNRNFTFSVSVFIDETRPKIKLRSTSKKKKNSRTWFRPKREWKKGQQIFCSFNRARSSRGPFFHSLHFPLRLVLTEKATLALFFFPSVPVGFPWAMEPLTYLTLSLSRMHAHTHPHALSFPLSHTHTHTLFPSLSLFLVGPAKKTVRWLAPKQRYTGENKLDEGKGRSVRWRWLWLWRADVQTDMVFKQAI